MAFRKIRETISAIRGAAPKPAPVGTVQEFGPAGAVRTMGFTGSGSTENKITIEPSVPPDNVSFISELAQ